MKMKHLGSVLCLLAFASLVPTLNAAVEGYAHRIDFSVVGYQGTTTLVNFPMLVRLSEAIDGFSYSGFVSPSGADLRFTLEDGTELAHEIEEWNSAGTSYVWVKVPALTAGLKLKMYWGKANDAAPTASVFADSGYWCVLHCNEAGGAYADATGNGNGGVAEAATVDGVTYTPSQTDGLIGKCVHLVGSELAQNKKGPSVRIANWATQTAITDTFTIGAWFRTAAVGQSVADDILFASRQFRLQSWFGSANVLGLMDPGCSWVAVNLGGILPGSINDGSWYHIVATFSGTAYQIYANGSLIKSGTLKAAMKHEGYALGFGNDETNSRPCFKGDIDDARVAPTVLSEDWIAAEYAQAATGGRFLSLDERKVHVVPPETAGVTPTPPYETWATAATNLADAIAADASKDPICVSPGNYRIAKTVTIPVGIVVRSCDPTTGLRARETTILDGSACASHVVTLDGGVLDGFTVANANVPTIDGGGVYVTSTSGGGLYNCVLRDNIAKTGAGAYLSSGFIGLVTNCAFYCNSAQHGSGLYAPNGITSDHPTLADCLFSNNVVNTSWGKGGAFYGQGSLFTNCLFTMNAIASGVSAYTSCVYSDGRNQFLGCGFTKNATHTAGNGGVVFAASSDEIRGCVFAGNLGACYSGLGWLMDCILTNNASYGVQGMPNLRNCLLVGNGGYAVRMINANLTNRIENCTLVGNKSSAICANPSSGTGNIRTVVVNSIVTGNDTAHQRDYETWNTTSDLIISNSVVRSIYVDKVGHDDSFDSDHWTYSLDQVGFTDAAKDDYTLQRKSPCRDKGLTLDWMTSESTDLGGNPRVFGSVPDLGCYECQLGPLGLMLIFR